MPTPKEIIAEQAAGHMPRPAHNMFAHEVLRALTAAGYVIAPKEPIDDQLIAANKLGLWASNVDIYGAMLAAVENHAHIKGQD